jgi:hypothetical protein
MTNNNFKIIGFILLIITLGIYLLMQIFPPKERGKKLEKIFHNTNIQGVVIKTGIRYHQAFFMIKGDTTIYVCNPIRSINNKGKPFIGFAKVGDSIIKKAHGDTLILIKSNNKYKYTFNTSP